MPGVSSWMSISVSNIFTRCQEFSTNNALTGFDSHLMKNTEWGAVSYLAHSTYGRNGTEVAINTNGFTTGGGTGTAYATTNTARSTTGNPTGIYDMSGCAYEYTAAYLSGGSLNNATNLVNATSKYKDIYTTYANAAGKYGDAIFETSSSGSGSTAWFGGFSVFPYSGDPFFMLGGVYNSGSGAGLFSFTYHGDGSCGGASDHVSFRLVMCP